jgi:hypothetical protein
VQELVSAGYNDLIIDLIPEPWSSIDSWVDKDKHFSALLRLFRNQMAALQEAQIKVDRSVKINVDLYNSVATYGKKRRKNAKINALTIIDLIPLSSEQRALPQDANEIVIAITRQSVVENAIEDQPREEYELMLPLNSANYAYFKPDSEIDSLASLQKTIQVIVRDNIKSVDRIQKMLRNQSILEEAKKNGLDVSVQLFANPYNDLEYLCTYADKSAVMYYANKAVPPSAPEGTTRSDLYGDAGGPYVLDIRKINPRTYRASKILMKALEEEGFERIKP